MKRLVLSLFLVFAATTMMAEEFTLGKLNFKTLSDTEVELVGADKGITNIDLNSPITDQGKSYSVTSIGECAFVGTALYDNPSNWDNRALYIGDCLIRLADGYVGDYNIKESTRLIANDAFHNCSSLTSITIPNSVTAIGFGVFQGCSSLTSITIPNSVTSIGEWAFYDCESLKSVKVPSHTKIAEDAFPEHTKIIRK